MTLRKYSGASNSQPSGAKIIVPMSALPRRAGPGKAATDGQTTRIIASSSCGGTTPVTACLRLSTITTIPPSTTRLSFGTDLGLHGVLIVTEAAAFAKRRRAARVIAIQRGTLLV